ncbi:hypothetical protein Psta_3151 [Pirellula staleyi DSM 6068]|uniref:DUF2383 domain-containing protein n=1 Tax=Pirellula staleyi (strain ATCC 27377 / DSM 6068 / ICPB 4128) TaxID=530564 RepID=D2QWL2_PIRSD|nr:hypothetical protein [Pirellula staleyi]ADB17815.1 hypothetical protein Psta_3151 [Pirellula staleyi DSM 6068]
MTTSTNDLLNRLQILLERSLPMYLSYAPPHTLKSQSGVLSVLSQMVEDQKRAVDRISLLIAENGGVVDHGEFPITFTSLHDLSAEYLVKMTIERQKRTITAIEKIADQLTFAPFAQGLAREVIGEAKGHLENLEELERDLAATPA